MEVSLDHAPALSRFPQAEWDEDAGALVVKPEDAREVAEWLRDDPAYGLDYLSNVTGLDYLETEKKERRENPDGTKEMVKTTVPARMEVVYHLYSMSGKRGPLVLKQLLVDRENPVATSLTPVYRSAEFQEREVYDLFGVEFLGHPDLRRILMWDEFEDFPMRRDYVEPDDYEYEPTPHGEVLEKTKTHLQDA